MVSLRRMGTIIMQLEAERLGALDVPRDGDGAARDGEEGDAASVEHIQAATGASAVAPSC